MCRTFECMKVRNMKIFEIHAAFCSILANPKRLAILACLDRREMSVGELAEALGCPMSTVSRHLTLLKNRNLVVSRHEGTKVFYEAADKRIIEACAQIRTVLVDGLKHRGEIALELDPEDLITEE